MQVRQVEHRRLGQAALPAADDGLAAQQSPSQGLLTHESCLPPRAKGDRQRSAPQLARGGRGFFSVDPGSDQSFAQVTTRRLMAYPDVRRQIGVPVDGPPVPQRYRDGRPAIGLDTATGACAPCLAHTRQDSTTGHRARRKCRQSRTRLRRLRRFCCDRHRRRSRAEVDTAGACHTVVT